MGFARGDVHVRPVPPRCGRPVARRTATRVGDERLRVPAPRRSEVDAGNTHPRGPRSLVVDHTASARHRPGGAPSHDHPTARASTRHRHRHRHRHRRRRYVVVLQPAPVDDTSGWREVRGPLRRPAAALKRVGRIPAIARHPPFARTASDAPGLSREVSGVRPPQATRGASAGTGDRSSTSRGASAPSTGHQAPDDAGAPRVPGGTPLPLRGRTTITG